METSCQGKGPAKFDNINIQVKNKSIVLSKMIFKGIRSIKIMK